ncbi:MAG: hypothetical protein ACTSUR_08460 [Candidatus Heimdallarchaeaceae archaeon]
MQDSSIKTDIRPEEQGATYVPTTQTSEISDQFSAIDYLTVNHNDVLNLTNFSNTGTINNSFSISNIGNYVNNSLNFNITEIKSIDDKYTVEDQTDGAIIFDRDDYYTLAQAFEVPWDYAFFYGSYLFLSYDNSPALSLGNYELSLHLVSTGIDGNPNMTDIISNCTSNPFSDTNKYSGIGIEFFDFTDVRLAKGSYYIVANLSKFQTGNDADLHFQWAKNDHASDGVDDGKTLSRVMLFPGQWSAPASYDLALINYLYPVDSNNNSIIFSSPDQIDLKDNLASVSATTSPISTIGSHELTSNTSVQISFNNSYTFAKTYSGNEIKALFSASNSSYWSYSVLWDINWTTPYIDISPYSNLVRYQDLATPSDWHNTIFAFYYNDTNALSGSRETFGYRLPLGANNSAGIWHFNTSSPNYISSLLLFDDTILTERFFLGYWVANSTHSIGYVGSKIVAHVLVQGDGSGTPYNETTGSLNYTLFDVNGNIIPMKTSLPANLVYSDTSSYTLGSISQVSAGFYTPDIYFDPSVSGSDPSGFWTAAVFWQNGTEVGYYSLRIVVQAQTAFDAEWETIPGSSTYTTSDISRKGLDSIDIRSWYYNVSEPYLSGQRNAIPKGTVYYNFHNSTWSDAGTLVSTIPLYTLLYNLSSAVSVGVYSFDLLATGPFLENLTSSFSVTVFYELSLKIQNKSYQTNYTNNAVYKFAIHDKTAGNNLSTLPDNMNVLIQNSTNSYPLSTPVDYTFTYQSSTQLWLLDITTSTNNLDVGSYSVLVEIQVANYRANYTNEYVSDVFNLEVLAPKTAIQPILTPVSIYTYHTVTFTFNFVDTNHSVNLTGAVVDVWFNVSDVSAVVTPVGSSYQVEVTSNNPYIIGISVYINVTKPHYTNINDYLLGELNVVIIQTELVTVDVPSEMYDAYNTSVVIQFNDLDNLETISGAYLESIITNSTNFVNISIVELGGGQYNITFINYDVAVSWLDMNITLAKPGYYDGVIHITIKIIAVQTDSELLDSSSVSIYYDTGTSFNILYWDNISSVNITDPQVFFSGNLTITPNYSFLNNITTITILTMLDLGYYELIITLAKPGYEPQIITVYILVQERLTSVDSDYTDITSYADQTDQVLLNYTDEIDQVAIQAATVDIDFATDNSTLIVEDYFIINLAEVGSFYEITFDPIEANATGYAFLFNITFIKYGYETNFIIITVIINIHPTSIDPSSQNQDSVYTDEDGEFTVIYETVEDAFISGAKISYSLINGTSAEIEDVVLAQILDTYVVYVYINSSINPVQSFLIELTFYKYGFENQTWTITITVTFHPTTIDPSSQNQDTIYADEDGEFTVIYETEEGDFVVGAQLDYNIINGSTAEILSISYSQTTDSYVIFVYFNESLIAGKNFTIELIFFKHGFENQTWVIHISVYEKITYEISVEIVGNLRQLSTIKFKVTIDNFNIYLLFALSSDYIKFFSTPEGDFVVITYIFTFANGTTNEYSIQAELRQIQPGLYEALTSDILVPWRAKEVSYSASYIPTSQSVISSEMFNSLPTVIAAAKFMDLVTYLFSEYTPYMAATLAVIAAIFISLTIYFAVVRPKKQRRKAKKRSYLDKISKIVTSVLSMRKIIVVHNETGLPIYEWDLGGEISVDSSLVSGFLQAVSGMGGEISGGAAEAVRKIDYGQFVVTSASAEHITSYLFSTGDISADVEQGLSKFIEWFETKFKSTIGGAWDGKTDVFQENARAIVDTLSEELFIWTLHPLTVNVVKEKEVAKLDSLSQRIYKFIKDYNEVSISVALEFFNKNPMEEVLSKIFELVDNTFLLRKRLRK